jgi:hypothetical protein
VPGSLTRSERDALVRELRRVEGALHPPEGEPAPTRRESARLWEAWYRAAGEYADRLPRVVMGASPFGGAALKRAFDPFGLDGPFWWRDRPFAIDEPDAPPHFKVMLGALALNKRSPDETLDEVIPGPEVPFVVPRLLELPGMVAVIAKLECETGDTAYPISYWSPETIATESLHQPWLRQELWTEEGAWLIQTDPWDFDLERWIALDKLAWFDAATGRVLGHGSGERCPYLDLPGDRAPQSLSGGERNVLELPDGQTIEPFPADDE